jgi:hypothetical protein
MDTPEVSAMTIQYRDISDFPGYRVGDDGSVWSRKRKGGNDRSPGRLGDQWRLLSQCKNANGYSCVNLFRDGSNRTACTTKC